jgi:hypothetical protein
VKSRSYATAVREADIKRPFLGNCLTNTFQLLGVRLLIIRQFDYSNGITVFSTWSVLSGYKQETRLELIQNESNPVPGGITGPPCSWGI